MVQGSTLIFSSSVYPTADITVISDPKVRQDQYIESLIFWIKETAICNIIVCDNSLYEYPLWLKDLSQQYNKSIEFLVFKGSHEIIKVKGKGYGEGEIIKYVLENSKIILKTPNFFKVTGRVKVLNFNSVIRNIKEGQNYFLPTDLRPRFTKAKNCTIDTRFYFVNKDFYIQTLLAAFLEVEDNKGVFLEHLFYEKLSSPSINITPIFPLPRFEGFSGTFGKNYKLPLYKWLIYNFIICFKLY